MRNKAISRRGKWLAKKIDELRAEFGGCCKRCSSSEDLEFAHIKPTGLNGRGRGRWNRYKNVRDNRDCYILLCKPCHYELDNAALEYDVKTETFAYVAQESEVGF